MDRSKGAAGGSASEAPAPAPAAQPNNASEQASKGASPATASSAGPKTVGSNSSSDAPMSPRRRPTPPKRPPAKLRYQVASHSVRITKHGYAIDPVQLKYPEIAKNTPPGARRRSMASLDSAHIGQRCLELIRGFWSQPGFPAGTLVASARLTSFDTVLAEFSKRPKYPHSDTFGRLSRAPESRERHQLYRRHSQRLNGLNSLTATADQMSPPPQDFADVATPGETNFSTYPASSMVANNNSTTGATAPKVGFFSMFSTKTPPSSPSGRGGNSPKRPASPRSNYYSWIPRDRANVAAFELISELCRQMESVFKSEQRIIKVQSPCLVLGDIHGNLHDLRTYERSLWPKAPACLSQNYLFLGDYVDRGEFSVECVVYLFSQKLLSPTRFYLLRGNHEVAAIQRQYTFGRECEQKFGNPGRRLWRSFNKVFDLMPIAAVIDEQIFCAHGGIPRSVGKLSELAKQIPSPLDNPELQCPSAWEILWNDPITDNELISMIEMDNALPSQPLAGANDDETIKTNNDTEQPGPATSPSVRLSLPSAKPPSDQDSSAKSKPAAQQQAANGRAQNQGASPQQQQQQQQQVTPPLASSALSFYIRPDSESTTSKLQQGAGQAKAEPDPRNDEPMANDDSNATTSPDIGGGALRTVPSDTSSTASTSPQQILSDGFVANVKRGTAYLFSDQAIERFLKLNNLSHVIRAHEVIPTGFAFHGDGRVITIFSSSKYCGLDNQAACALVDRNRIRILTLDTGTLGE